MDILKAYLPEKYLQDLQKAYPEVRIGSKMFVSSLISTLYQHIYMVLELNKKLKEEVKELRKENERLNKIANSTEIVEAIKKFQDQGFKLEIRFKQ